MVKMDCGICGLDLDEGQLCICDTCKNILASGQTLFPIL
jgi:hypothetical protein